MNVKNFFYNNQLTETPVWFMRQAGRYLPEYRLLRETKPSFLDLCFDSEVAAEISLQPIKRFNFDAIILFSDILVIPYALNQDVSFVDGKGPVLGELKRIEDLENEDFSDGMKKISSIFETLKILKQKKKNKTLIGFCGGPFTVMNYMVEKKTSKTHEKILYFIKKERNKAISLITILQKISVLYLIEQIKAGADVVKVFDSWAGLLNEEEYETFIIKPNYYIRTKIKEMYPQIQIIFFPRMSGRKLINFVKKVKCDILSLDEHYPREIKELAKKEKIILQGNLNPQILLQGGIKMERKIQEIMLDFEGNKHIFNLSHGILPNTPISNVKKAMKIIKSFKK